MFIFQNTPQRRELAVHSYFAKAALRNFTEKKAPVPNLHTLQLHKKRLQQLCTCVNFKKFFGTMVL